MKINSYFESLSREVDAMYEIAWKCRRKSLDPEDKVDIVLARDVSERVEGLVGSLQPIIIGKGIPNRIRELETKYSAGEWRIALIIAEEVALNKFGEFPTQQAALETGVRVGLAYLTLGIVSAPLEGFVELKIKQRLDGKQYLSCFFAGPIRAAGGTAAAVTLIIADYLGKKFNYNSYDPTKEEIERYTSEIDTYHSRIARLQYLPDDEEIKIVLKNLRVEINGDPTSKREVLMHKYLPRVETPCIRGGMCLVFGEGLCQKAKKIIKNIDKWGKDFGMSDWVWLNELLEYRKKKYSSKEETAVKLVPNSQYIEEAVAGRPIFGHPSRHGGFRLRYGRSRVSGIAAASMHPATMAVLNNFVATGTQLKLERPGKACIATPCDSIEGPIVILKDGSMIKIDSEQQADALLPQIKRIPFIGDILLNYGDFVQFASILAPSAYVPEWWVLNANDKQAPIGEAILKNPTKHEIAFEDAIKLSKDYSVPLHPNFLFRWRLITIDELKLLFSSLKSSIYDGVLKIQKSNDIKSILEKLLILHKSTVDYYIVEHPFSTSLLYQVGYLPSMSWKDSSEDAIDALSEINKLCEFKIMDTAGTPIGARMGRPEKAKIRKLKGAPQGIFPCGKEGGRMRNLVASFNLGYITSNFPVLFCDTCNKETIYNKCETCESKTKERLYCEVCTQSVDSPKHCGKDTVYYKNKKIDAKQYLNNALKKLGVGLPELVKGVKGTWSKKRIPEHVEKAILRAMHDVYVNKDGTIRYDMIETPITHFKPSEIGVSVEKLKELGYEVENEEQVIPIMPQDIILPDCPDLEESRSPAMLIQICNFIDDLLVKFYNEDKFYNVKTKEDLIGQLVIGLAPHTSAGIVGRIIGFSQTQGFYAHPYYHAAMRRNCDGDESSVMMLLDGLLNFSRQFLPDSRGSRSVTSDTIIYLEENGKIKCSRIGDYIDEQFKNKGYRVDLDGYEILDNNEDINAISFDKSRTAKFCKISKFIRHINDKKIYKIKTSNGCIKTTEDHSLFTVKEGEITEIKASELKKGDEIVTLAKLKIPKSITEEVNVLDLLDSEELYIVPEKHNLEKIKATKAVVAKYGNNFYRYQNGTRAAPIKFYNDVNVRPNCRVRLKPHSKSIPYEIKLNEDFFELLGFIYAEGHIKQNGEIEVGSTSPEIIEHISKTYENLFYEQPTIGTDERKDNRIYLPAVFGKLLFKLGIKPQKAKNKEVPAIVYRSSNENINAFIYGYLLGDGSVKDDYLILYTASEKLASGLSLLPYLIGGKSSVSRTKGMYMVCVSRYKPGHPYWPLRHMTKELYRELRKKYSEYETKMKSASKHKILELISQTNGDELLESDLRVERIVKIEELNYEGYVYDLEVPGNQNFLCGPHPIFAHNSMDAPLVLTTVLVPNEVDDEVHNLDVSHGYPIELYENSLKLKYPWDLNSIQQIKQFLGKEGEYGDVGYTHPVSSINLGPKVSAYKTLATMMDKVEKQMELAEKIDAVSESDVASMVIEKHFLKDIKGNLRRFGSQNVRCVECNEKYRRVTMSGVCTKCKGKLILTVAHGTVTKYIEPSEMLIDKYNVPPYLKQVFETIKRSVESVFKVENKKQTKLMNF